MATKQQPRIPEKYLDVPSQRLYYLSFGLLCQAIKLFDFLQYYLLPSSSTTSYYGRKWLLADFTYCFVLSQLRIPRLNYTKAVVLLQIFSLWFLDGLLFGGIRLNMFGGGDVEGKVSTSGFQTRHDLPSTPEPFRLSSLLYPLTLIPILSPILSSTGLDLSSDSHLLGQHTIHMSPISTAYLNPQAHTFCLSPNTDNTVLVPILLNNTEVANVRYTITPLGYVEGESGSGKIEYVELGAKELKAIEASRLESLQVARATGNGNPNSERDVDDYEYDEYDDEEDEEGTYNDSSSNTQHPTLQKTQSITHIRLKKPGTVRLERVLDTSNIAARLSHPLEVIVVPCPTAEFAPDKLEPVRCAGQVPSNADTETGTDLRFTIDIRGVPPLSLRWFKDVNGRKEYFLVEGIEGGHRDHHRQQEGGVDASELPLVVNGRRKSRMPRELKVPLDVSLDGVGRHTYVLEEVIDGVGNTVAVEHSHSLAYKLGLGHGHDTNTTLHTNSKTTRSLSVLHRPSMSFKHCGPGSPTSLLIGSEAPLTIAANEADTLDAPWEVSVKYQPPPAAELEGGSGSGSGGKRFKAWKKNLTTQKEKKELTLRASAPGEYTIVGIKGKWCEGDVLAPETCKVVEKQRPSAEIEWKRIHECSGDTGVSASLVLHGTPPFQIYYRTQRDKEQPRDLVKTFPNARGELTLQPERSGHYVYTFVQMSDANYKNVELNGPSIDQVVHPLAAAEFVGAGSGARSKRMINSCSGNIVDVEVDLRGTGPWNLEVQVVGPKSSETLQIPEIKTSRTTIHVPIPDAIDKEGGSFDIELASIEDSYGCKRSLSVAGITANVRRVKPTAKFYGKDGIRHVTVLEHERASLPLRLTGDGPWRLKYRRVEPPAAVKTVTLRTPNDQLNVMEDGIYEITEVMDSQCPGSVIIDESTYRVEWVPRPSAKLAPETVATYTSHNRSHILPPICEGIDDHVDLDLTGRAPFQILYNIAQDDQAGGTNILEQPTFSSIQHRTRFQLHTTPAGRKYYEVKQIGDAPYPLAKHKNDFIPRSERLLFEQQVYSRPTARFRSNNRMSYCLYDALVPQDAITADGHILLHGTPPFELQISIKNLAASKVETELIKVHGMTWTVSLPLYKFESIGPHLITIESVQDASRCEQAALDPLYRSIWVDVAETAAIIPINRRENFCVGEISYFQLEGIPPWTIGYRINGKSYTQEAKVSPFSLLQQQPGEFTITSVAHQQKTCKAAVTDLQFTVHPLPAARVGHGDKIYEDIHEGDQAEIVFTLLGEPPFTFTYQRSEPSPRKGVKPGKILETHTVSGVSTKEYSIFSALEGTWTVTSIADRHCRYPPAQPDGAGDNTKRLTN